jgi:hypothetical protein
VIVAVTVSTPLAVSVHDSQAFTWTKLSDRGGIVVLRVAQWIERGNLSRHAKSYCKQRDGAKSQHY